MINEKIGGGTKTGRTLRVNVGANSSVTIKEKKLTTQAEFIYCGVVNQIGYTMGFWFWMNTIVVFGSAASQYLSFSVSGDELTITNSYSSYASLKIFI